MEYESRKSTVPLVKEGGWTVEEYQELPEDGNQYEMYNGQLELMTSPTTSHQRFKGNLEWFLKNTCRSEYIFIHAPVDVVLSRTETRQPDIVMIHRSREHIIEERAIVGPPDLVVEILSPSTAKNDRTRKKASYAAYGVPEYWIVDPFNQTLEQYVLQQPDSGQYELLQLYDRDDTVCSDKLPCVSFALKDVVLLK